MRSSKLAVFVSVSVLVLWSAAGFARTPYVALEQRLTPEQLREVGLSPQQLAALNRMLGEADARDAHAGAALTEPAPQSGDGPQVGAGAAPPRAAGTGQFIGLNDEPIKSRLKHDVAGWEPGTVFELENGQQWKVLKGSMKLRKPMAKPEIVVVPGVAGRWFLQVDEDMPKARVYRID